MNPVSTVGLDLAKYIFLLHGADSAGAVVFRKMRLSHFQWLARVFASGSASSHARSRTPPTVPYSLENRTVQLSDHTPPLPGRKPTTEVQTSRSSQERAAPSRLEAHTDWAAGAQRRRKRCRYSAMASSLARLRAIPMQLSRVHKGASPL
jgi:hypothetical protein